MWTSLAASDFIAIGATVINENFSREIFIMSMMKMTKSHTAEYVKFCIESMINEFIFYKSNIHCKQILLY